MTRSIRGFLALTVLALAGPVVARAQAPMTIVVLPFENGGSYGRDKEDFEALRLGIAAMVASELSRNPAARTIERERVQSVLSAQGLAAADKIDVATAVRVGKLLGARYVIVGTFIDLYGDFRVDARLVDVQAGEILKGVRSDPKLGDRQQMYRIIQSVADRIEEAANLTGGNAAARTRNVPSDALALYSRALLYQDRGDRAKAIEFYNKAISAFPDYTEAKDALSRLQRA